MSGYGHRVFPPAPSLPDNIKDKMSDVQSRLLSGEDLDQDEMQGEMRRLITAACLSHLSQRVTAAQRLKSIRLLAQIGLKKSGKPQPVTIDVDAPADAPADGPVETQEHQTEEPILDVGSVKVDEEFAKLQEEARRDTIREAREKLGL